MKKKDFYGAGLPAATLERIHEAAVAADDTLVFSQFYLFQNILKINFLKKQFCILFEITFFFLLELCFYLMCVSTFLLCLKKYIQTLLFKCLLFKY